MENENEKKVEIEEICKKIENLTSSDSLSEDEKLEFAREALKIISREEDVQ